jgi:hypothetical protein
MGPAAGLVVQIGSGESSPSSGCRKEDTTPPPSGFPVPPCTEVCLCHRGTAPPLSGCTPSHGTALLLLPCAPLPYDRHVADDWHWTFAFGHLCLPLRSINDSRPLGCFGKCGTKGSFAGPVCRIFLSTPCFLNMDLLVAYPPGGMAGRGAGVPHLSPTLGPLPGRQLPCLSVSHLPLLADHLGHSVGQLLCTLTSGGAAAAAWSAGRTLPFPHGPAMCQCEDRRDWACFRVSQ